MNYTETIEYNLTQIYKAMKVPKEYIGKKDSYLPPLAGLTSLKYKLLKLAKRNDYRPIQR